AALLSESGAASSARAKETARQSEARTRKRRITASPWCSPQTIRLQRRREGGGAETASAVRRIGASRARHHGGAKTAREGVAGRRTIRSSRPASPIRELSAAVDRGGSSRDEEPPCASHRAAGLRHRRNRDLAEGIALGTDADVAVPELVPLLQLARVAGLARE